MPTVLHKFFFDFVKKYTEGKRVLDIGCWTGGFEYYLQNSANFICAIDIEERALSIAKSNLSNIGFLKSDCLNLPFQQESFDVVTMWAVIEHIPKKSEEQVLKEINRILKPGGILCMNTMNDHFLSKVIDPAFFLKGHRHYATKTLKKFLNNTGFRINEIFKNGRIFTPLYLNMLYIFKYVFRKRMPRFKLMEKWQRGDYYRDGFNEINIIAQKI